MDTILQMINDGWVWLYTNSFAHKLLITLILTLLIIFYRIIMANYLYIRRNDKLQWIVWSITLGWELSTLILNVPDIWLICQLPAVIMMIAWKYFSDRINQAKSIINSSNIIFQDTSDKNKPKDSDAAQNEQYKQWKETKITRKFKLNQFKLSLGVPVFQVQFWFMLSPQAGEPELMKVQKYLNDFYVDYTWKGQIARNGKKYFYTAELKQKMNKAINFPKELSDQLPWYMVPLGVLDTSSPSQIAKTPYVWKIQDPGSEGIVIPALKDTKVPDARCPQGFCVGSTGGGKSVFLNSVIAHLINKAKTDKQTNLWLVDAKRQEFTPFENVEEVAGVAYTIQEANALTDEFVIQMFDRQEMLAAEEIKSVPLDGNIKLNKYIDINGRLLHGMTPVKIKKTDGAIENRMAWEIEGMTDIDEIDLPERKNDEEDNKKDEFGGFM